MNDIIKADPKQKIIEKLLVGDSPEKIAKECQCQLFVVLEIVQSDEFSELIRDFLERDIQISGIIALKNIKKIASDDSISKATQLKANQWIAEKALEYNRLGTNSASPSTMTQDQLARRLKDLQNEALKRAKPIDTGVIDDPLKKMME
jgi:hypothetical protein